ncbi:hypothetical protein FPZ41_28730 [Streptomyces sp. K1PN6]|uniref:Uncharacterized protein n=1 Tax=Streptomyces acidicola TaxID=2596892 RepID=A0A5N8WY84_9ACTN|nr:hypothetical protein [Streptomyces acidicola]
MTGGNELEDQDRRIDEPRPLGRPRPVHGPHPPLHHEEVARVDIRVEKRVPSFDTYASSFDAVWETATPVRERALGLPPD